MEGLGLLGGEIDRNTQQALTKAALGQQQIALQAQGLMPMALQTGERGFDVMGQIGGQRGMRSQQELMNDINDLACCHTAGFMVGNTRCKGRVKTV